MDWKVSPIAAAPTKTLDAWSALSVPLYGMSEPWPTFLIGFRREGCTGQVSSPIAAIDPVTRRVATADGHVYLLSRRPGLNSDAFWLWRLFRERHRIVEERDVTDAIASLFTEPSQTEEESP